jgi:DNA-directed RNA polymerase subunit RPC12/RpoP
MIIYAEYHTVQTNQVIITDSNGELDASCPNIAKEMGQPTWGFGSRDFMLIVPNEEILKRLEPYLKKMVNEMDKDWNNKLCPKCGSENIELWEEHGIAHCNDCKFEILLELKDGKWVRKKK